MTRKLALGILLCISSTASAEGPAELSITSFDPASAVAPISVVEGPGVKVGEGTVLRPVFGIETGFVSNVFYDENPKAAGILRLLAQVGTSSLGDARLNPNAPGTTSDDDQTPNKGMLQYNANLRLAYDQMLSGNEVVSGTGGLGAGLQFRGMVNPMNRFSFGFDENFLRSIRASNFETDTNANRDLNTLRLTFLYHPQQRSLSGYVYLQNIIDVFEQANDFYPNRMDTRAGFHLTWQWLPKTQFFGDISEGMVGGLGSSAAAQAKSDSFPLIARVGIASLLSLKTSVNLSAGYTNGFYSTGPSFSAPYVDAAVTHKYSPFGQLGVGYSWLHVDSVNANYYRDHVARAFIQQLFAPFAVMIQPEVHFREYVGTTIPDLNGGTTRDDVIFQVISGVHYNFRNWIAATIDYKFTTVQTDFSYMEKTGNTVDLNYVRHELLLGMRFAM